MKKSTYLFMTILVLLYVFPAIVFASEKSPLIIENPKEHRSNLYFGVKFGANYSNVYDAQGEDFVADAKYGIAVGGFVSIPIIPIIGIQPELLFSQKGYNSTGTFLGNSYSMTGYNFVAFFNYK